MSSDQPTDADWDNDDALLNEDTSGIYTCPSEKDEVIDEDALLGIESGNEDGEQPQQPAHHNLGGGDFDAVDEPAIELMPEDDLLDDEPYDEIPAPVYGRASHTAEVTGEDHEEGNQEPEYTAPEFDQTMDADDTHTSIPAMPEDESESEDEGDRTRDRTRDRFKSERSNIITVASTRSRTDIPDTLEITQEDEQKIASFIEPKRGAKNQRGFYPRIQNQSRPRFPAQHQHRPAGIHSRSANQVQFRGQLRGNNGRPGMTRMNLPMSMSQLTRPQQFNFLANNQGPRFPNQMAPFRNTMPAPATIFDTPQNAGSLMRPNQPQLQMQQSVAPGILGIAPRQMRVPQPGAFQGQPLHQGPSQGQPLHQGPSQGQPLHQGPSQGQPLHQGPSQGPPQLMQQQGPPGNSLMGNSQFHPQAPRQGSSKVHLNPNFIPRNHPEPRPPPPRAQWPDQRPFNSQPSQFQISPNQHQWLRQPEPGIRQPMGDHRGPGQMQPRAPHHAPPQGPQGPTGQPRFPHRPNHPHSHQPGGHFHGPHQDIRHQHPTPGEDPHHQQGINQGQHHGHFNNMDGGGPRQMIAPHGRGQGGPGRGGGHGNMSQERERNAGQHRPHISQQPAGHCQGMVRGGMAQQGGNRPNRPNLMPPMQVRMVEHSGQPIETVVGNKRPMMNQGPVPTSHFAGESASSGQQQVNVQQALPKPKPIITQEQRAQQEKLKKRAERFGKAPTSSTLSEPQKSQPVVSVAGKSDPVVFQPGKFEVAPTKAPVKRLSVDGSEATPPKVVKTEMSNTSSSLGDVPNDEFDSALAEQLEKQREIREKIIREKQKRRLQMAEQRKKLSLQKENTSQASAAVVQPAVSSATQPISSLQTSPGSTGPHVSGHVRMSGPALRPILRPALRPKAPLAQGNPQGNVRIVAPVRSGAPVRKIRPQQNEQPLQRNPSQPQPQRCQPPSVRQVPQEQQQPQQPQQQPQQQISTGEEYVWKTYKVRTKEGKIAIRKFKIPKSQMTENGPVRRQVAPVKSPASTEGDDGSSTVEVTIGDSVRSVQSDDTLQIMSVTGKVPGKRIIRPLSASRVPNETEEVPVANRRVVAVENHQRRVVLSGSVDGSGDGVLIRNLSGSTNEDSIRTLTERVGPLQSCAIDPMQRTARVHFQSPDHASAFVKKYNRFMLDLSMITVTFLDS